MWSQKSTNKSLANINEFTVYISECLSSLFFCLITPFVLYQGSIDPWHALSVLEDLSDTETAIYIPGTAHCANMHSDESQDPQALRKARQVRDI